MEFQLKRKMKQAYDLTTWVKNEYVKEGRGDKIDAEQMLKEVLSTLTYAYDVNFSECIKTGKVYK